MKIPFMNLNSLHEPLHEEIFSKLESLIRQNQFIGGKEIQFFEEELADFCRVNHAVGCSNGTDAIFLALKALGIGPGDKVLVPVNTFIATSEAVSQAGAEVDFIDVDPKTYTLDVDKLADYLKSNQDKNIKALIPVHLYGQMANMPEIKTIADKYDLKIIEDTAQAHGASLGDKPPGFYGDAASFSFYPGKNLGAFGDAGAVVSNNEALAVKIKRLANHGRWNEKYTHQIEGFNKRIDSLQAAVLRIKLKKMTEWNQLRKERASKYKTALQNIDEIILPEIRKGAEHVWHLFVIQTPKRDDLQAFLKEKGISSGIHYPIPLHLQPAYKHKKFDKGSFPVAETLADKILSLPFWPYISDAEIDYAAAQIRDFFA